MLKAIPRDYFDPSKGTLKLLWEEEWRGLGITQARITAPCLDLEMVWLILRSSIEPGLGTLRGARAGTAHSSVQVRFDVTPGVCD